jgi:hypothetical protein
MVLVYILIRFFFLFISLASFAFFYVLISPLSHQRVSLFSLLVFFSMYMVCSVPIPTSFPNIAQGRKTHSKGVLIMASPRFRLVMYAWHLNFCISCIVLLQVWVAREGPRLSSKATTISARPTLSSQINPGASLSYVSPKRYLLPDTSLKPLCCNPRLES